MADIKTTVNAMTKTALTPVKPVVEDVIANTILTKVKIETIAKELAQPWKYGTALHRFAKLHNVPIQLVREINDAVTVKAATFKVVELIAPLEVTK